MGQRLVAQTELRNVPWTFDIVDDPAINAFSIPGGHVYVNRGLIAAADQESELAGVLAHEISHVVARHSTEQLSRQYGLSVVAGAALGQNPEAYAKILAQVLAGGALARFSRAAEDEADKLGVRTMFDAGYDPNGMVTMFEELLRREQSQPNAVDRFFATHPLTADRITSVRKEIAKLPARSGLATDSPAYQAFRRSVAQ
jgi:predicted Zn-dependent protease